MEIFQDETHHFVFLPAISIAYRPIVFASCSDVTSSFMTSVGTCIVPFQQNTTCSKVIMPRKAFPVCPGGDSLWPGRAVVRWTPAG